MTHSVRSWHYGGIGAVFVMDDMDEGYPTQAAPAQLRNMASDDQPSARWPYFPGDRQQKTVFIRDLGDPQLIAARPIPVSLEFSDGQVTACCYDVEQFGVGEDEFGALDDLRAMLVELYRTLKAERSLGPFPERQLTYLASVLKEV